MKTQKSRCNYFFALVGLFVALLACNDKYGDIDPAIVAPQDLSNMDLSWNYMAGFDFSNKNLTGVNFSNANLEGANFSNSNCQGANFNNATLLSADFSGAILDKKWELIMDILTTGSGAKKNLPGYDFSKTYMPEYDFSGANLHGANFQNSMLEGTNFSEAILSGTNFSGTVLIGSHSTNFMGADLTESNFLGVDFYPEEDLDGKKYRVNFAYANLTNSIISPLQLRNATLICTILPDGSVSTSFLSANFFKSCPQPTPRR